MKNKVALNVNTWGQSKCCEVQGNERRPGRLENNRSRGKRAEAGAKSRVASQIMTRSLDFPEYNAMSVGYGCVTTHKTKSLPF